MKQTFEGSFSSFITRFIRISLRKNVFQVPTNQPKLFVNWRQSNLQYFRWEDYDISINRRLSGRSKRWNRSIFHIPFPSALENHLLWKLPWVKRKAGREFCMSLPLCELWASASLQGNLWWYCLNREHVPAGGRRLPEQSSKYADELAASTADQQTFPHWWKGIVHKVCFQCWDIWHSFGIKV